MFFEIINEDLASEYGLKFPVYTGYIKRLEPILANHSSFGGKLDRFSFNLVFVSKSEMSDLNKEFRMKELPTDVLSFTISTDMAEIYLCPEYIDEKLKENDQDITLTDETFILTVHGILHIAGYDHTGYLKWEDKYQGKEEMFKVQAEIVAQVIGTVDMDGVN